MASKSTTIKVNITGDARDAMKAIHQTTGEMMTMQQKTTTAISGMASAITSAGVVQKIGEVAKACTDAAGDLQQSIGGVETVFGDSADQMLAWSDKASQAVGLSKTEYDAFATIVGSQLQNFGMSVEDSASKTNDLIGLGADLASMFGGTTADAVDALSSALKGEMDPIERYGISLNDATLQAQAASLGIEDLYKAGDRNAKMQATLAAVTAQSGKAVGNFAREAGTAQGQQQRMTAAWTDAQAALGEALLPALTAAAAVLAQVSSWIQQNATWLTPLAVALGVVAGAVLAVNAAMSAYAAVTAVVAVAQGALNLSFLPIIAVIAAVVAVIVLLAANWESVKRVASACAQGIRDAWESFTSWWAGLVDGITTKGRRMWDDITSACQAKVDAIASFFQGLKSKVAGIFDDIVGAVQGALSWVGSLWDKLTGASSKASEVSSKTSGTRSIATPTAMPAALAAYQPARAIGLMTSTRMSGMALAAADMWLASSSPKGRTQMVHVTNNFNFNAPQDRDATAREIKRLLRDYDARRH